MSDMVTAILTVAAEGPDGERVPAGQPLVMTADRADRFRARGYLDHMVEPPAPAEPVALDEARPARRRKAGMEAGVETGIETGGD